MNVWTITGNLGHSPKVRNTRTGEQVLNLNVAVAQRVKRDGQWTTETLWVDVTLFGARAEGLGNLLAKGQRVGCTGALNLRRYEGRDGQLKTALELIAHDIEPLEPRREGAPERSNGDASTSGHVRHRDQLAGGPPAFDANAPPPEDDDIPF